LPPAPPPWSKVRAGYNFVSSYAPYFSSLNISRIAAAWSSSFFLMGLGDMIHVIPSFV
jgi:hypothetical protein